MGIIFSEPFGELEDLIRQEEKRIGDSFPVEMERRLALMELARAMDYHWGMVHFGLIEGESSLEAARLIEFGLNKAITLFLDESTRYPNFPLMRSPKHLQAWADSVLQYCGRLGQCEYFLDLCRCGLAELVKDASGSYIFRYADYPIGLERVEREDGVWYSRFVASLQEIELRAIRDRTPKIKALMLNMTGRWNNYYIQYDACPEVDEHYEEQGLLYAQRLFGQDSFPNDALFGGQPFNLYRGVLGILIGWALKHMDFALVLLEKYRDLDPRNIMTVPQDLDVKAGYLAAALEIDVDTARQAMDVVTLSLENAGELCGVAGNFVAPAFIKGGRDRLICPLWGCLSHPFQTMLDELKRKYRADWDRNVESREVYFREELYALFPSGRFEKIGKSVKLRIGGKLVTDIDAIILDRHTGTAALFQLKWQDHFRYSMRARESRKRNLQATGNQWVDRVSTWLTGNSLEESGKTLGFEAGDARKIRKFVLIVVGRNAAHFSGPGALDSRAVWGNWYQILRIIVESPRSSAPLDLIYEQMIKNSPINKAVPSVKSSELRIGKSRIILEGTAERSFSS